MPLRARHSCRCLALLAVVLLAAGATAQKLSPIPVVLDTDIGSDIDDAFALAMALRSPELQLRAVTTVSGDTQARARIAARMLSVAGRGEIPVAAGAMQAGSPVAGAPWAQTFHGPALVSQTAVELMRETVEAGNGRTVVIAIGALTNVAALLRQYPQETSRISEIVLMGGSFHHGYTVGSGQIAESNIASDVPSAQVVFRSGVAIRMAPLDATARLQLQPAALHAIFAEHTPLTEALHTQYLLWGQSVPTLHDPMAIALLLRPDLCTSRRAHVTVTGDGRTIITTGPANALVATSVVPARFIAFYQGLFTSRTHGRGRHRTPKSRS